MQIVIWGYHENEALFRIVRFLETAEHIRVLSPALAKFNEFMAEETARLVGLKLKPGQERNQLSAPKS